MAFFAPQSTLDSTTNNNGFKSPQSTGDSSNNEANWIPTPANLAPTTPSTLGGDAMAVARGLANGVTLGADKYIAPLAGYLIPGKYNSANYGGTYTQGVQQAEQDNNASQQAHPWLYGAGNLVGSIPTIATGEGGLKALDMGNNFIRGLALNTGVGAISGATSTPIAAPASAYDKNIGIGAGAGATLGTLMGIGVAGKNYFVNKFIPNIPGNLENDAAAYAAKATNDQHGTSIDTKSGMVNINDQPKPIQTAYEAYYNSFKNLNGKNYGTQQGPKVVNPDGTAKIDPFAYATATDNQSPFTTYAKNLYAGAYNNEVVPAANDLGNARIAGYRAGSNLSNADAAYARAKDAANEAQGAAQQAQIAADNISSQSGTDRQSARNAAEAATTAQNNARDAYGSSINSAKAGTINAASNAVKAFGSNLIEAGPPVIGAIGAGALLDHFAPGAGPLADLLVAGAGLHYLDPNHALTGVAKNGVGYLANKFASRVTTPTEIGSLYKAGNTIPITNFPSYLQVPHPGVVSSAITNNYVPTLTSLYNPYPIPQIGDRLINLGNSVNVDPSLGQGINPTSIPRRVAPQQNSGTGYNPNYTPGNSSFYNPQY